MAATVRDSNGVPARMKRPKGRSTKAVVSRWHVPGVRDWESEKHLSIRVTRKISDKVLGLLSYMRAFQNSVTSNVAPFNTIELEQNIVNLQISYKL